MSCEFYIRLFFLKATKRFDTLPGVLDFFTGRYVGRKLTGRRLIYGTDSNRDRERGFTQKFIWRHQALQFRQWGPESIMQAEIWE